MICIYSPTDTERRGHGMGVLHPISCKIAEEAGGSYELTMELPIDRAGEAALIQKEAIIRAPGAPHRLSATEQDFRIHGISLTADGARLEVKAQHLFYDASYAIVKRVEISDETACEAIASQLMAGLIEPCGLTMDAKCQNKAGGSYVLCSLVNALLDPESGLVAQGRLELERDRNVIRLRDGAGRDSGVVLRYGGSLRSLSASQDIQAAVTRLYPMGEDSEGGDLMLPEKYIDTPGIGDYSAPRTAAWKVTGAKVGQKTKREDGTTQALTEDEAYAMLREAAAEKIREGCDKPQETVSFVHVPRPVAIHGAAEDMCLYDKVRLRHEAAGLERVLQVTGYTWDVLRGRYESVEAGDPWQDRTADMLATAPQLRKVAASARRSIENYGDLLMIEAEEIIMHGRHIALLADDYNDLEKRTSSAEIVLDGMNARINLLATKAEVSDMGKRLSQAEIDIDGANAAIDLKASRSEVNELGTRMTAAEISLNGDEGTIGLLARVKDAEGNISQAMIDIDGAKSQIALKANKIDLQGYVTIAAFEAVEGWTDNFAGNIISGNSMAAGEGDFDNLKFGSVNGTSAGWKSQTVVTTRGELAVFKRYLNLMTADGGTVALDVVTGVSLPSARTATIKYIGSD